MKFGRPLGHSWFGYGDILCVFMYLLDLVELLLDNTHEAKLQAFTKKYSGNLNFVTFILLLLLLLSLFSLNRKKMNFILCTTGKIDTVGAC